MKVKLNIKEIFDTNSEFELKMLQVFSARNDLNIVNVLLQKNNSQRDFMFLFKIMLGILRESVMLIVELTENHKDEISRFHNAIKFQGEIERFSKLNSGIEKDSFSCKVLSCVRHQIFHYNETKNAKEILLETPKLLATFEWDNTLGEIEYTFANELTYNYIIKKFGEFSEKEDENEFAKFITPYSICVMNILETLTLGYLEKYTNICDDDFDGQNLKRKDDCLAKPSK